jgi:hypothetical protein
MGQLSLNEVVRAMAADLPDLLAWQVMDPQATDYGAPINREWGTDDPGASLAAPLIAGCAMLYLHAGAGGDIPDERLTRESLLAHASAAVEYLLRYQRPSGFIDLKNFLPDSSADTAFVLQPLCMVLELGQAVAPADQRWAEFDKRLRLFVHRAATGMLTGGFGTPNHRWVVCSALAQAGALFDDIPVRPVIDSILAEGIDMDGEGFYMERSATIYDPVSNRSLLLLADFYPGSPARDAVRKNLELNLHMLHADATGETGLSHRQDHGAREVPLMQGSCYLHSALVEPNPQFAAAAALIWNRAPRRSLGAALWYYYILGKFGEPCDADAKLPDDYSTYLPANGLWRLRRGQMSASVFRGNTAIMSLVYGKAELKTIKMCQAYYGTGRFRADSMEVVGNKAHLRFEGNYRPFRPGAFMPLGRPIPNNLRQFWQETAAQRQMRWQPRCISTLEITEVADGFDLHYKTLDGLDRVCAEVAFDFAPGGVWQTDDTAYRPRAGDEIFLRRGYGRMTYGADTIEIGPGAAGHCMWQMRDSELAPHHVRITIALVTPIDQVLSIRLHRGLAGVGRVKP